ncbi:hypothetical protein Pmani_004062 [Petrolisthes manimaculis]|uniref:Uncharacterized protein n=1 Tax=Petrolisthes manimaculis TaxID=1843537 RepID=A0AAE1QFM0_9EUCA|nr:hypothetical protein Pmani_004062 [Petrolisthes manimaculis]
MVDRSIAGAVQLSHLVRRLPCGQPCPIAHPCMVWLCPPPQLGRGCPPCSHRINSACSTQTASTQPCPPIFTQPNISRCLIDPVLTGSGQGKSYLSVIWGDACQQQAYWRWRPNTWA